jgi:4-amino-4-deoxy-L-arabinose transferase-like glycosyltransferase
MSTSPQDLYTIATLGTFAGSSGAVLILYNTFRRLFNKESVWIAFIISLTVSVIVAIATSSLTDLAGFFLVILNGCLLFSSAAGTQELIAHQGSNGKTKGFTEPNKQRKLSSSWFR